MFISLERMNKQKQLNCGGQGFCLSLLNGEWINHGCSFNCKAVECKKCKLEFSSYFIISQYGLCIDCYHKEKIDPTGECTICDKEFPERLLSECYYCHFDVCSECHNHG